MNYIIKKAIVINHLLALFILFPIFISFIFSLFNMQIPTYLFIIVISIFVICLISNTIILININKYKIYLSIFFAWVLFGFFYTDSIIASKIKFITIWYNTLIPIIILELFFVFTKERNLDLHKLEKTLLRYTYFLVWLIFIAFIFFGRAEESKRYFLPGSENPLVLARYVGMYLIILVYCGKKRLNFLYIGTILILIILLFASGGRGPTLSTIITFFFILSFIFSKKKIFLFVIIFIGLVIIGFKYSSGYLFESNFWTISIRLEFFKLLNNSFNYIIGSGLGSFGLLYGGVDITAYPHNTFLELYFENGLIGVFIFCFILRLFYKSFKPNIVNFLCVYYFLCSLFSGDIPGNNYLYILLFISIYANKPTLSLYNTKSKNISSLQLAN